MNWTSNYNIFHVHVQNFQTSYLSKIFHSIIWKYSLSSTILMSTVIFENEWKNEKIKLENFAKNQNFKMLVFRSKIFKNFHMFSIGNVKIYNFSGNNHLRKIHKEIWENRAWKFPKSEKMKISHNYVHFPKRTIWM